jgi:hypothetical protein
VFFSRLPDEWVPLEDVVATKTVRLSLLPEAVKARLQHQLMLTAPPTAAAGTGKQPRKSKRVEPPSVFLTPDEVAAATTAMLFLPSNRVAAQPPATNRDSVFGGCGIRR